MRLPTLLLLPLLTLLTLTTAWTKEDHEIFRLRDELISFSGPNTTFYTFLGVARSASLDEINKQYRSRSRAWHPDKAVRTLLAERNSAKLAAAKKKGGVQVQKGPTQKERAQVQKYATERYAHLALVAGVLRGPARDRYDHFLAQGFPAWKGTGYYYARFRPGLGSVLLALAVVVGGAVHYAALYIGWKRHKDFVERYIDHAKRMAWGDMGIGGNATVDSTAAMNGGGAGVAVPGDMMGDDANGGGGAMNRRQKRMQEKSSKRKVESGRAAKTARNSGVSRPVESDLVGQSPMGSKKKVVAENGKVLIVDSEGNVFLEETTEEGDVLELLLDPNEIEKPTIFHTALFRVPVWAFAQLKSRITGNATAAAEEPFLEDQELITTSPEGHETEVLDSATSANMNAEMRKRKSKSKN